MAGKPKPTALKLLEGNPGRRPIRDDEPEFLPIVDLEPPDYLEGGVARKKYQELMPKLARCGLATEADIDAIACYCEAWSRYRQAQSHLRQLMVAGADGDQKRNPYHGLMRNALDDMRKFWSDFGMTPSARVGLSAPAEKEIDPFDAFIDSVSN